MSTVSIIMDKMTGRSRGFGFVEMSAKSQGDAAGKKGLVEALTPINGDLQPIDQEASSTVAPSPLDCFGSF